MNEPIYVERAPLPVTQTDLDRQTVTLRNEIVSGDQHVLEKLHDHREAYAADRTRFEVRLEKIDAKQDKLLEAINRRMGRDDLFWKVIIFLGPLLAVAMAYMLRA